MKKIFILSILSITLSLSGFSQAYFQGGFALGTNDTLIFKMKPVGGDITTAVIYIEAAFRVLTAEAPTMSASAPLNNTVDFPGLAVQLFPPNFVEGNYTYIKFIHNTATVPSKTYTNGTEYVLFKTKLSVTPIQTMGIEMASDLISGNYVFGVVDGAGNQIDPGAGDQLYGSGFYISGNGHYVPLFSAPVLVSFTGFNVAKSSNNALLNWSVSNESPLTAHYEIERSLNGFNFTKIATIQPKNNGSASNTYDLTDYNLKSLRLSGNIYYRVKQYDMDGRFVTTNIRNVRVDGSPLSVYPNPVKNSTNLTYELADASNVSILILDASGKQVKQVEVKGNKGSNVQSLDMSSLANGTYMINVQIGSDEVKTLSVVKSK